MEKNETLAELQEKHRMQMKERRDAIKQRKARTRRLIVHGAVAEGFIENSEDMNGEEFQRACANVFYDMGANATSSLQESCGSNLR